MPQKANKQVLKRKKKSETATVIAEIFRVTPRHVRLVMDGERENQDILDATIIYEEGKRKLKSTIVQHVEKVVPIANS